MPARTIWVGLAAILLAAAAPPETGRWRTQDRSSVIAIAPCGQGLCGHVIGISLAHPTDAPPRDIWGGSQCGETIIRMPEHANDGRWHGTILDPRSGRTWRAQIWHRGDTLHLRGYIGLPLFGATQLWTPYAGATRPNCDFDH
jgi:uncharacterized protein (DUF2147 family)